MECPNEDTLRRLCLGNVDSDSEQWLVTHVDQCAKCQAKIDSISDPLASSAQLLREATTSTDSQLLRDRLGQLKAQRPSPPTSEHPIHQDLQPWIESGDTDIGRVGHYDLIRCIGRGGMGVVFEAFDQDLQRTVALKMMSPALLIDPANCQRFLREARAAAAINHPSVVAIHAVSKTRDLPYLVMELVEGESLQQRLTRQPGLSVESVIEIATQLADGLAAAHARGVVHRDVKPANILMQTGSDSIKLTDFGLAYTMSENPLTQTGTLLGTPEYLAPEQIEGSPVDHRSDLFSLGSVIYHMCVGQPPFVGQSIVSTLRDVASLAVTPVDQANPKAPSWLSKLVEQLHAKNPADRIPDAQTVSRVLRSRGEHSLPSRTPNERKPTSTASWLWPTLIASVSLFVGLLFYSFGPGENDDEHFIADNAEELIEYLEEHDGDLVVELGSDEPFLLGPLEFDDRSVEVFAEEGEQPVLVFRLPPNQSAITHVGGRLTMSGVRMEVHNDQRDIEELEGEEEFEFEPLISCVGGSLFLNECVIDSQSRPCIELVESDSELTGMTLESEGHAIRFIPAEDSQLQLESSTVRAESAIGIGDAVQGKLNLQETTFETDYAIELTIDPGLMGKLIVSATGNQFECEEAILAVYDVDQSLLSAEPEEVIARLPFTWTGSDNTQPESVLVLFSEDEQERAIRSWK